MAHNIDMDKTLIKLNEFGYAMGLPFEYFERVYVKDDKLMAVLNPKSVENISDWFYKLKMQLFPKSDLKEQIWCYLDVHDQPIPTLTGEHKVIVKYE